MLIDAWARVRPEGWLLRIAGPDEAGHQKQLEGAVSAADLSEIVSFTGPVESQMKKSAFLDADLFVLPSHSESFGMVVAEALAYSVPVLTTTATPWSILRERGCGWCGRCNGRWHHRRIASGYKSGYGSTPSHGQKRPRTSHREV